MNTFEKRHTILNWSSAAAAGGRATPHILCTQVNYEKTYSFQITVAQRCVRAHVPKICSLLSDAAAAAAGHSTYEFYTHTQ